MKKLLFEEIKNRLIDRVPELKTIGLFNNQFSTEKKINPFVYPAAFIEFESFDWKQQGRGIQIGNAAVKIHVGFETYKTNISSTIPAFPEDDLFFDLIAKIHVALNGFDNECFTPLIRMNEQQDADHDNVLVWATTYGTQITDDGAETRFAKPMINLIPDVISGLGLTINFPEQLTPEVVLAGAWWWLNGYNPQTVMIYWRFDFGTVDPDTIVVAQYNNGNGWVTASSRPRSEFVDGDGIHDQHFQIQTSLTQMDPPTTRARIVLSGIGHSNEFTILPD